MLYKQWKVNEWKCIFKDETTKEKRSDLKKKIFMLTKRHLEMMNAGQSEVLPTSRSELICSMFFWWCQCQIQSIKQTIPSLYTAYNLSSFFKIHFDSWIDAVLHILIVAEKNRAWVFSLIDNTSSNRILFIMNWLFLWRFCREEVLARMELRFIRLSHIINRLVYMKEHAFIYTTRR
jgi:hypothetical protein